MSAQILVVQRDEEGMRLDRWFKAHFPALGHGLLEKLCRKGSIRVDGGRVKPNARLGVGQSLRVPPEVLAAKASKNPTPKRVKPELIRLLEAAVIYRDKDIMVLNKPSGLAVQGGTNTEQHIDGALPFLKFDAEEAPRLVHRLDRDTSGILLLARNRTAAQGLTRAFAQRDVEKIYWALVHGVPRPSKGHIDLALSKRPAKFGGERMLPAEKGDPDALRAKTDYAEISRAGQRFSWLALRPLTGRTHQLRAHMVAVGTPIVGDPKYRIENNDTEYGGIVEKKLHLHARSVNLRHPRTGAILKVEAPLEEHMKASWQHFGFDISEGNDPFEEA